jgi:hypothetical protein
LARTVLERWLAKSRGKIRSTVRRGTNRPV